ncbi:hypothetical protein [Pseudomonas lactucae]|uniref:hypothetical protein n=1 Tax=Pseudomonas lactucae TaxID=2813360 RepID=UPI002FCD3885
MKYVQRMLLALCLTALSGSPALAAFGDNPTPAANTLAGDSAAGSALPPGNYPSSPSDSDKKNQDTDKQQEKTSKPAAPDKDRQQKPRSGS